jgi:hypothetical protein
MRFLLRMAFWLTVILALLPSGGSERAPKINVSAVDAMSAAKATVGDMGSFCHRQPEACTIGSQAAVGIGHRAQAGAKMLYEYLNERFRPNDHATAVGAGNGAPKARPSQHTLAPADLAPAWRGPRPQQSPRREPPGAAPLS